MKVIIVDDIPRVQGLAKGETFMFFAKIDDIIGYCIVFGQEDKCLPTGDMNFSELFDAKVAFGKENKEMQIVDVKHGHKYRKGGGMVETEIGDIFFRLNVVGNPSTFEGKEVQELLFTS